jgi:hypothetical protein
LLLISILTRIGKLEGRGDPVRAARHSVWLLHRLGFVVVPTSKGA